MANDDTTAFVSAWNAHYPGTPPRGYLIRDENHERWLRLHTLPDNKRLPKSPLQKQVVLQRLNRIASHLFPVGSEAYVVLIPGSRKNAEGRKLISKYCLQQLPVIPHEWLTVMEEFVDPSGMTIWVGKVIWETGCSDDPFLAAALDVVASVVIFEGEHGNAMCPYDGGVDLFLANRGRREQLMSRFETWLPPPTHTKSPR